MSHSDVHGRYRVGHDGPSPISFQGRIGDGKPRPGRGRCVGFLFVLPLALLKKKKKINIVFFVGF